MKLFQALPKLKNLEVINFGDCLIRTEGAQAIAGVFKHGLNNLQVNSGSDSDDILEIFLEQYTNKVSWKYLIIA